MIRFRDRSTTRPMPSAASRFGFRTPKATVRLGLIYHEFNLAWQIGRFKRSPAGAGMYKRRPVLWQSRTQVCALWAVARGLAEMQGSLSLPVGEECGIFRECVVPMANSTSQSSGAPVRYQPDRCRGRPRKVAMLIFPGAHPVDIAGPMALFGSAARTLAQQGNFAGQAELVSGGGRAGSVVTSCGLEIVAAAGFGDAASGDRYAAGRRRQIRRLCGDG